MTETFTATGAMGVERTRPRLTLLPSGDVLVTGGAYGAPLAAQAEIYQPATGAFRAVGPMRVARREHAGVALPSGEILLTGGCADDSAVLSLCQTPLRSAELFDPRTGTFRAAPAMPAPHWRHGMVRLPTGKILVVGGETAELYDPAAGTFTRATPPASERDGQNAHLLPSGKVFVAGGPTLAAELYDPHTDTWSFTAPLPFSAAGTLWTGLADGRLVSSGGNRLFGAVRDVVLFDPIALPGVSQAVHAADVAARTFHAASLLSTGSVLVTGGYACWGPASARRGTRRTSGGRRPGVGASAHHVRAGRCGGRRSRRDRWSRVRRARRRFFGEVVVLAAQRAPDRLGRRVGGRRPHGASPRVRGRARRVARARDGARGAWIPPRVRRWRRR